MPTAKSKKPPERKLKVEVVRMRVTAEQKQAMNDAAARDGLDLSQWLRQLALRAAGLLPAIDNSRRAGH